MMTIDRILKIALFTVLFTVVALLPTIMLPKVGADSGAGEALKCALIKLEYRAYIEGQARVPFGSLIHIYYMGDPIDPEKLATLPKSHQRRVLAAIERAEELPCTISPP